MCIARHPARTPPGRADVTLLMRADNLTRAGERRLNMRRYTPAFTGRSPHRTPLTPTQVVRSGMRIIDDFPWPP
jgi:hypothetical protein